MHTVTNTNITIPSQKNKSRTPANLSILKNGKAKAVRFSTLEAICQALNCQVGDILEYRREY